MSEKMKQMNFQFFVQRESEKSGKKKKSQMKIIW